MINNLRKEHAVAHKQRNPHFNLITHHAGSRNGVNPDRLDFFFFFFSLSPPFPPDQEVQLPAYTTQGMHGHSN